MKITLLCPDLVDTTQGGIPTVTRQALRQLERLGDERGIPIEFDIWALHDKPTSVENVAQISGMRRPPKRFRSFCGERLAMVAAATRERHEHDFVFTTHIGVGLVGRLLRGRQGKLVQFIHGSNAGNNCRRRSAWEWHRPTAFCRTAASRSTGFSNSIPNGVKFQAACAGSDSIAIWPRIVPIPRSKQRIVLRC